MIFDCCHSGSGTRNVDHSQFPDMRRVRGFETQDIPPASLDQEIWSDVPQCRDVNVVKGFAQAGTKSHVLLAACRETESAFENNRRGYFTQELLRALRSVKPDKVTYKDLMKRVSDIPGYVIVNSITAIETADAVRPDRPRSAKAVTLTAYCSMRSFPVESAQCTQWIISIRGRHSL